MSDDQDDLFGPPFTRAGDPITSHIAPEDIDIHRLQRIVLDHFEHAGSRGLTDLDLQNLCGDHGSTFRTRRAELVEMGLIVDSGEKRQQSRPGKAPRWRIVWILRRLRP